MINRRRFTALMAMLAAFALLAMADSPARAGLTISVHMEDVTNGGATFDVGPTAITSGISFDTGTKFIGAGGTMASRTFQASLSSTATEDALSSNLNSTTIDLSTMTGGTLEVFVTVQGFVLPGHAGLPMTVSSSASGTSSAGTSGQTVLLQSWADGTDAAFGMAVTPGVHSGALNGNAPTTKSYAFGGTADLGPTLFTRGATYSLTQKFLVTLTPGKNASLTLVTATLATPEPSTMAMVFSGLPLVGLAGWMRRRRSQA